MVSLAEALNEVEQTGGRQLVVDRILDDMSDDDADLLRQYLAGPLASARIAKALKAVGHQCGEGAINLWRERNGAR